MIWLIFATRTRYASCKGIILWSWVLCGPTIVHISSHGSSQDSQ